MDSQGVYDLPNYTAGFPIMPVDGWKSDSHSGLGWIDGLHSVASSSINSIFGDHGFKLNEDNLAELPGFSLGDYSGAIAYIVLWAIAGVIFMIAGILWCLCKMMCCCCCPGSVKGRVDDEMGQPPPKTIGVTVMMGIWLFCLLLCTIYAFGAHEKATDSIDEITPDLDHAATDVFQYCDKCLDQLNYTFVTDFGIFKAKVDGTLKACENDCDEYKDPVQEALGDAETQLSSALNNLTSNVHEFRIEATKQKDDLLKGIGSYIMEAKSYTSWLFTIFNIIYLVVFGLVLGGFVLVAVPKNSGLRTVGYLLMRAATVIMFILSIFVVIEVILLFVLGGAITAVACPAIRRLEGEPQGRAFADELAKIPKIIRRCKDNQGLYHALEANKTFDINKAVDEIKKSFDDAVKKYVTIKEQVEALTNAEKGSDGGLKIDFIIKLLGKKEEKKANTAFAINANRIHYLEFVRNALGVRLGRCKPLYNALNGILSLFCDKLSGPLVALWFILQFIVALFPVIIITEMVFEKFQFEDS